LFSIDKRIDDAHAGLREISAVPGGDRQAVDDRRRSNEAILDRHSPSRCAKTRKQFRPLEARVCVPRQTVKTPDPGVEPALQGSPLLPLGKNENPEPQFADNHGIDGDVGKVIAPSMTG